MPGFVRSFIAAAVAASLGAVPSAAIGAAPTAIVAASVAPAAAAPSTPWVTLSAMTTSSSAASAAAGQHEDGKGFPPIAPLVVILATIATGIYILLKNDNNDSARHFVEGITGGNLFGEPVSPA